jgi:tetratricopeptide (TPR) repeat protein
VRSAPRGSPLFLGLLSLGLWSAPSAATARPESWIDAEIRRFRSYPHLDRAYRLIDAGEITEARRELAIFLVIDPAALEPRLDYMDLSYRLHDYPETVRQAGILLERSPGLVTALVYRGLARVALDELDGALQDLSAASRLPHARPADRALALTTFADLAIQRTDWASALEALDSMPDASRNESYYSRRGMCLDALGHPREAEEAYGLALDRATDRAPRIELYRALGETRKKRRDWSGAREAFTEALALHGDDVDLMRNLGELSYAQGDYGSARDWMARVLAVRPNPTDRELLVQILLMNGERERAVAELRVLRAEVRTPTEERRVLSTLGQTLADEGRPREATDAYRAALKLGPSGELHLKLGRLLAETGKEKEALEQMELAERLGLPENLRRSSLEERATLYSSLGSYGESIPPLEEALRLEPGDAFAKRSLAIAYSETGRVDDAVALDQALLVDSPNDAELLAALGHLQMKRGSYSEAATLFERASGNAGGEDSLLLASWGEALFLAKRSDDAIRVDLRLLDASDLTGERRGETLERLGYAYIARGEDRNAALYLERAIDSGRDRGRIRQDHGLVLYRLGRFRDALEEFFLALDREKTDASLVYAARCLKELNRPGLAIHYLSEALPGVGRFDRDERIVVYNELGFLYANESEYERASDAWARSLELRDDPEVALRLGRAKRLSGLFEEARLVLEGIDAGALSDSEAAQRLDELSVVYERLGRREEATETGARASEALPTAERHYRLGLLYRGDGRWDDALSAFRSAVAEDPGSPRYAEALGSALARLGATDEAIARYESVLARDRDYLSLFPELGYLYMKEPDNESARTWFERAIDNEPYYPVHDATGEKEVRDDMLRFRREVAKVTNRFDVGLYTSLRSDSGAPPPAVVGPSALPSQGGVELSYLPPGIGFRDERVFEAFVRVLWNHEPGSLQWDGESLQGGLGVRYKPLPTQNLRGSLERLFPIGGKALSNWLARGLYSWSDGYEPRPGHASWNSTLFQGEVDTLLQAPKSLVLYGEFRQGWTFNISDSFLVTPHLVVVGRDESPSSSKSSYVEAGPGVSFKFLFRDGRYYAPRSSFEVFLQYRSGRFRDDVGFHGWVVMGSMHF